MPSISPPDLTKKVRDLCQQEKLPEHYAQALESVLLPVVADILGCRASLAQKPCFYGINGPQGSGKSTLCKFLQLLLRELHALNCVVLSLDDFYLSQEIRQQRGKEVHPLYVTRGVPGTHDTELAHEIFDYFLNANAHSSIRLPAFNKAMDNPLPRQQWPLHQGQADVILFEGWCVGVPAQNEAELMVPVNTLEALEDADGIWRRAVNTCLAEDYQSWWQRLDGLLFLQIDDFKRVLEWRSLQEQKLRDHYSEQGQALPANLMSPAQIARFIQHYERLTRWGMQVLPQQARLIIPVDAQHRMTVVQAGGCA